ncbi:MAG: hypothetical protein ACYC6M_13255 [Terriglobales bacterium]
MNEPATDSAQRLVRWQVREIPGPVWLELYSGGKFLGQPADPAAADVYMRRSLPSRKFRLIMRAAGRIYLEWDVVPSFGAAPVWRLKYCAEGGMP